MSQRDPVSELITEVVDLFRKRRPAAIPLEELDEDTQRRLILQVARRFRPGDYPDLRKEQPTVEQINEDIRDSLWMCLILCWTFFAPLFGLIHIAGRLRLRALVRRHYAAILNEPDPDCEFYVAEGAIRRLVRTLPRSHRRQGKVILQELATLVKRWTEIGRRQEAAGGLSGGVGSGSLERRREDLEARIEVETDPMVRESMKRQLRDIQGQLAARQDLAGAMARLDTVRAEILECLQHLRSRLSLMSAQGIDRFAAEMPESVGRLHDLNREIQATTDATEEVLRLGRR